MQIQPLSIKKDIQLVLANNRTITFEEDADIKYDKKGGITANTGIEQIKVSKEATKETTLNTLIVPKGKRSSLTLADGSKVWVNSGSTLKFPSTFKTDKREIWVDGEIYIEVEKISTSFLCKYLSYDNQRRGNSIQCYSL